MMSSVFVDFKIVKDSVSLEKILGHYNINWLQKSGDELVGRCPIHLGDGQRSFHVNFKKKAFNCFSCKAKGNVLDFVAAMEKCSIRDAALKMSEWFPVPDSEQRPAENRNSGFSKSTAVAGESSRGVEAPAENKPLPFTLKGIDHEHPYLSARGIDKKTAEEFGIGYFGGKGSMSGRIVIPIHSERGELVAYAGRSVVDDSEPKYKLPPGFHKSLELYNLHRAAKMSPETVVLVEGYFGCLHVEMAGYSAVALMGSSLSTKQEELLEQNFDDVWIMMDGDEAGRKAADDLILRLSRRIFVRRVDLPDGKQPDDMTADELKKLLL